MTESSPVDPRGRPCKRHKSGIVSGGQKTKNGWSQNFVAWSPVSQVKMRRSAAVLPPNVAREGKCCLEKDALSR